MSQVVQHGSLVSSKLSGNDLKELALNELMEIRAEIVELATDKDVYWKVQRDVIQQNRRLLTIRSAFFDMLNDSYAHAVAARVRRLVDDDSRTISLKRLLEGLRCHPELLNSKIAVQEVGKDLAELQQTCGKVKDYVDQYIAHHDRSRLASAPTHGDLNVAIDALTAMFRKYYGVLADADIDVVVEYLEEPLKIFRFPWIDVSKTNAVQP